MTGGDWIIRDARPGEAAALTALTVRSKAHWGYDEAFMAACREELTVTSDAIRDYPTRVIISGTTIGGYYRLEPAAGGELELGMCFVDPPWMGRGLGKRLMADAVARARERGATGLIIQSDPFAEPFYRHCGAERIGERPSASVPGRVLPVLRLLL